MEPTQDFLIQEEKLFAAFETIGIDKEQARVHLDKLAEAMYYRTGLELNKLKQPLDTNNLSEQEYSDIMTKVFSEVYGGYFKAITSTLSPEKRGEFEGALGIEIK